jgi:Acetyltransferases
MNVRSAEQYDKKEIEDILVKSFSPTYAYYAKKSFAKLDNVLVSEDEGKVTGVLNWKIIDTGEKKIGYLFWLAVLPEHRRLGVAKKLIGAVINIIQQEIGQSEVYAAVEKYNTPSRRLIESLGFTMITRSDVKKKYGLGCLKLYTQMMLLPKEDLFIIKL